MQIDRRDRPAPPPSIAAAHRLTTVRTAGIPLKGDLADAYLAAAKDLGARLASEGAAPAHIRALTIYAPDPAALLSVLPEIDLRHREALAGNFGEDVALLPGDALRLEAHAVLPDPPDAQKRVGGYSVPELNAQYSPRSSVPEAGDIMARWRVEGGAYQAAHAEEIAYGPEPAHRLDLYRPAGAAAPVPLHVFIHGGYWQALDKRDNGYLGRELVAAGIAVAALNYPLCPPGTVAGTLEACRMAVAYLIREARTLGLDADNITVSGHSAGGHLVGMLACTDWQSVAPDLPTDPIRGTLSISGLFDVVPLVHTNLNSALRLTEDDARAVSPVSHRLTTSGPVIAAVGGAESDEFRRQSREFASTRSAQGHDVRFLEVPEKNHFTVVEALADPASPLLAAALSLAGK